MTFNIVLELRYSPIVPSCELLRELRKLFFSFYQKIVCAKMGVDLFYKQQMIGSERKKTQVAQGEV